MDDGDLVAVPDSQVDRNVSTGFIAARTILAVALILALAEMHYAYYQALRWAVCGVGVWGVYEAYQANREWWAWTFGVLAVVFNPLVPSALRRETWMVVDICTAVGLILSLRYVTPPREVPTIDFPWYDLDLQDAD